MKIIPTLIAMMALPLLALGQATDQQQDAAQNQKTEHQEKTPPKKKKARQEREATQPQNRTETGANTQGRMKTETRAKGANKPEMSSSKTETKVNKEEFKSRHTEVYNLGRHPKEFFVKRYGANHVRLIGNTYFVFVDDCWVSVDVAGFGFVERTICPGDTDYVVVY